ncbi:putative ribonuclease H protein [Vitis vinifera]|uniref:Putative ribonuclease H protein n=1 Tax=Vitis vinifera TaxID=29760 RepID=A0A438F5M7_VITVI|nr:putative ribonuclease H protein [Vitis vinifera]
MEEVHWRQLSRELWLREGDRNTGFFHRMANARRKVNILDKIKINGVRITEEQEVREGIANAYQQILSENPGWKADIGGILLKQISLSEAEALELPFSEVEIYAALMGMNGDKAPGPDGFTVAFWQKCWEIVKEDVLDMFTEFHEQNSFIKSLNHTFLVFVTEERGVEDLGDYRPISLLGGLYKLLVKNAFIKGRQILDGSLIANEVMQKMGFGPKWIGWMWSCISTTKFSVLVNGVPAGFFSSSKGLRQGDPLSPYLFVLGMEVLREVEGVLELAAEIGCRVGQLPYCLFGAAPWGANRASFVWGWVARRLEKLQRDFLWGGANGGNKAHLVKWEVVCADKEKGGLGLRKLVCLNKALLGKWIWRFARAKEELWKKVLEAKYGQEEFGWRQGRQTGCLELEFGRKS